MVPELRAIAEWHLREALLQQSHIPVLEQILERSIGQVAGFADDAAQVSYGVLREQLLLIKPQVDAFVQAQPSLPCIAPSDRTSADGCVAPYYCDKEKVLYVAECSLVAAPCQLAHEYTHHCQMHDIPRKEYAYAYNEGVAGGVERAIARQISETSLQFSLLHQLGGLKSTYTWMCCSLGRSASAALLAHACKDDAYERGCLRYDSQPSQHAMGNSFFAILEELHGECVYAEGLQAFRQRVLHGI